MMNRILRARTLLGVRHCASSAMTNIGYLRLAFNVGASDNLALRARVFNTPTGHAFLESCPHTLGNLSSWGDEVYGALPVTLPSTQPQSRIPPGGLAYSDQGQYLCIFFGQAPAWPVTYFAQVEVGYEHLNGGQWRDLSVSKEDPLAMESY